MGGFMECEGIHHDATAEKQPADIIIAIDTSGSMDEESAQVQQHLNDFALFILDQEIDVHVVLIADDTVCIPMPLGSGNCAGADSSPDAYLHVVQTVDSTNALSMFLSTYDLWKDSLRPEASKTFLVVSDDESAISAAEFTSQILAKDPPTFDGFKFDAIVGLEDPNECTGFTCPASNSCCYSPIGFGCVSYLAEEGQIYQDLVAQTGGVQGNLCDQEFGPIFQDMADAVVVGSQLACDYDIPEPDEGQTLDPGLVNVDYTPGGQQDGQPIYNVPGGLPDCGASGGWYYDNPADPTKIIMCPSTCDTLQGDAEGSVDVIFGCETEVVPR